MRVLVVGSGGREHALAWKLAQNPSVRRVFAAPGNPGIAEMGTCLPIEATEVEALAAFALSERIDLTVVGPEAPLAAGIVDAFQIRGLPVFGPTKAAARLESSKAFCRDFAARQGIPTPEGAWFDDPDAAIDYARSMGPVAVKADGLAAGKGVTVCDDADQAEAAINACMRARAFGDAGDRVVIEERLEGRETSVLVLTDGDAFTILEPAQDYKRIGDNDQGPNTGGMGAYSPVGWLDKELRAQIESEIVQPLVQGMAEEGNRYTGCLFAGVFITDKGPKLYEVNCRFGDPETQVVLPRFGTRDRRSDFLEAALACCEGNLRNYKVSWSRDHCVCVVVASGGYPGSYRTGVPITGLAEAAAVSGVTLFHAGTALRDGQLVSASGRVLNVVARARTQEAARAKAYEAADLIQMENKHYRTDIAS